MVHAQHPPVHPVDVLAAWQLLLELATRARAGKTPRARTGFAFHAGRWLELPAPGSALAGVDVQVWLDGAHARLEPSSALTADGSALLELFLPLVLGPSAQRLVLGHLGQSLDGRVATPTGASQFITGREDIVHTHRLRALFDAVIVGVRTVELDDPRLTTRLVSGAHPARVVLDPGAKLAGARRRLLEDGAAPTFVFTSRQALPRDERRGAVLWLPVECRAGRFDLAAVIENLRARGLQRLFVEGGGVTVSGFLAVGALDRLHVSVAPLILGSGAPAFALPPIDRLDEALSMCCRHHALGRDMLFDCELVKKASRSA